MTTNREHDTASPARIRIALIAGTLGQAGAEKQLVYMARSLRDAGAGSASLQPDQGGVLRSPPAGIGNKAPLVRLVREHQIRQHTPRLASLALELARFRPHIVQSGHFFCNLYAGLCGRLSGALTIGAMRNDLDREQKAQGRLTRHLLRLPSAIIANSQAALRGMEEFGVSPESIVVLENVIDLEDFDARLSLGASDWDADGPPVALAVGRLHREKRFDRFLAALALARRASPVVRGVIVGDGPEWPILRQQRTISDFCQTVSPSWGVGTTCQPCSTQPICSFFPPIMKAAPTW